jgi:hypothetical protein
MSTFDIKLLTWNNRWFKKKVYETNHSNVEMVLLAKINMQITIRLILQNGFYHRDGELTALMNRLYNQCPTMFDSVLPRTDRQDMTAPDDELENELDVHSGADSNHRRATIIGAIPPTTINRTLHVINDNRSLPRRHDDMSEGFKRALREAYVQEYGLDEIYQFGRRLQYSNKFAFTDRYFLSIKFQFILHSEEKMPIFARLPMWSFAKLDQSFGLNYHLHRTGSNGQFCI